MQLVCNYCCNVMTMLTFIHPSMMNFIDSIATYLQPTSVVETHYWLQLIGNYVTTHINTRLYLCVIAMYPICKWQLGNYYGITTRRVHPLTTLMFVRFFIHPSTNLSCMIFHLSINKPNIYVTFHSSIDKQNLLISFATKCLIMGSNVIVWQLILEGLDN